MAGQEAREGDCRCYSRFVQVFWRFCSHCSYRLVMRVVITATAIAPAFVALLISFSANILYQYMTILMYILRRPSSLSDRGLGRQGQVPGYGLGEHRVPLVHHRQHEVSSAKQALSVETAALVCARRTLGDRFPLRDYWLTFTQARQPPHRNRSFGTPQICQAAGPQRGHATEAHDVEEGSREG